MMVKWQRIHVVGLVVVGLLGACYREDEQAAELEAQDEGQLADELAKAAGSGGEVEAQVTCTPPMSECGGGLWCADLSTSWLDCGRCGHSCGYGNTCSGGMCQPAVVAPAWWGLDAPTALAVTSTAIYWTERNGVKSCPLPGGCTSTVPPTAIATGYGQTNAIAVTGDKVFFTGCKVCDDSHDFLQCSTSGCGSSATRINRSFAGHNAIALGAGRVYWQETTEAVRGCTPSNCLGTSVRWGRSVFGYDDLLSMTSDGTTLYTKGTLSPDVHTCPASAGCASPSTLPNTSGVGWVFRVHGGDIFWLAVGGIYSCWSGACSTTTAQLVADANVSELEVDASGVYWISGMAIKHCPSAGCPVGGPTVLTNYRSAPKKLTLFESFLYWIEGNTIYKVAKP